MVGSRSLLEQACCSSCRWRFRWCCSSARGCSCARCTTCGSVDVGFNPQNLVLFRVNPQLNRYDEPRTAALYEDMLERLGAVPGVRAVALSNPALLSGSVNSTGIFVQGRTYRLDAAATSINRLVVSPNFFDVMAIPLVAGRGFTARDDDKAPKVAMHQRGGRRGSTSRTRIPIGQRIRLEPGDNAADRNRRRRCATPSTTACATRRRRRCTCRTRRPRLAARCSKCGPPAIRRARWAPSGRRCGRSIRTCRSWTCRRRWNRSSGGSCRRSVFAQAYALFGGLALLLASIGLFGLMSYSVARRTNEIGIRMALGAQRQDVLRLVMRESMMLVVVGVVIGLAVALGAGRLVATLLFGLPPTDVLSTCWPRCSVMIGVSAFAGYLPARARRESIRWWRCIRSEGESGESLRQSRILRVPVRAALVRERDAQDRGFVVEPARHHQFDRPVVQESCLQRQSRDARSDS